MYLDMIFAILKFEQSSSNWKKIQFIKLDISNWKIAKIKLTVWFIYKNFEDMDVSKETRAVHTGAPHCYKNDSLGHRVWIEVPTV